MATAKARQKRRAENEVPLEELGPSARIAREIVVEFRDLTPSVDRIMNAGLTDDECLEAMTLFRSSLGSIGDPNRDPRVAIENSRTVTS